VERRSERQSSERRGEGAPAATVLCESQAQGRRGTSHECREELEGVMSVRESRASMWRLRGGEVERGLPFIVRVWSGLLIGLGPFN